MASIEYITNRISGKEKEIEKLTKKLARIEKAKASGWEVNPYYYGEHDLKSTTKDLETAKEALVKLNAELTTAKEKADSRNVKAIVDFLEGWKKRVTEFYERSIDRYLKAREDFWEQEKQLDWFRLKGEERERVREERRELKKQFASQWGYMIEYIPYGDEFDWKRFKRDIKNEADRKYDSIIERTNKITGTITDATGLTVGDKGELDGFVIGEKGTAHVHTIGAGGYYIQCYHFRVLVHEVK